MPELPEVQAIASFLDDALTDARFARIDLASISALKTVTPSLDAFDGRPVDTVRRRGKFLVFESHDEGGRLLLVVHLARAGWLHWRPEVPAAPPRPGKGPLVLRITFIGEGGDVVGGADITEAGTRKGLAVWAVRSETDVPRLASLGPEPLEPSFTAESLGRILAEAGGQQIKGVLRDQSRIAGIGNAYSDEVLHVARLSPYAQCRSLDDDAVRALHGAVVTTLTDAIERSVGQQPALLKSEKRAGMRVHGRAGSACPMCGDVVREVSFADSALQYCATCQTGGKPLADRRMSKLLK